MSKGIGSRWWGGTDVEPLRSRTSSDTSMLSAQEFQTKLSAVQDLSIKTHNIKVPAPSQPVTESNLFSREAKDWFVNNCAPEQKSLVQSSSTQRAAEAMSGFIITTFGSMAVVFLVSVVGLWGLLGLAGTFGLGMFLIIGAELSDHYTPLDSLRARTINRKKYRKAFRELIPSAAERSLQRDKVMKQKAAKMEQVKRELEPLSQQYAIANPGKKLDVSVKDGTIVAVKDEAVTNVEALTKQAFPAVKPSLQVKELTS